MTAELVRYDAMCRAIEEAHAVDVDGDRGLCSLPRFRRADEAKEDAWAWLSAAGLGR